MNLLAEDIRKSPEYQVSFEKTKNSFLDDLSNREIFQKIKLSMLENYLSSLGITTLK